MYKVSILNELNGRSFGATFESKEEKDAWVAKQVAKQSWGKPEREVLEENISEELRARILSTHIQEAVEAVEYQPAVEAVPGTPEHYTNGTEVYYLAEEVPQIDGEPDPSFVLIPATEGQEAQPEVLAVEAQPEVITHTVKADYVITETNLNLSKTYRNQCKIDSRKQEYPSLEEILHIVLDHGLDSQEYADLQALRAAVKAKYPLES